MKKEKENQKNYLINKTLEYLKDTSSDFLNLSIDIIFNPEKIVGGLIQFRGYNKSYIYKKVSNLKNSSYFSEKNSKVYLTEKGRIKIIKNILKDKREDKNWDSKWWAIIFDIPELNRRERSFLRRELSLIGFKEIQKSVWIFPFDVEKELLALIKLWKKDFTGDIRFLKIEKISDDKDIRKFFGL
jgi:virulence-associated protein VapD